MKYLVDLVGGRHYHLPGCEMTKDPRFSYTEIDRRKHNWKERIRVSGKYYMACPACIGKSLNTPTERKV